MCTGIALALSDFPVEMAATLTSRVHERGGEKEVRFLYRNRERLLPVLRGGQLELVRWGGKRGGFSPLPVQGWTWLETVESRWWKQAGAERVDILATCALSNGVWYFVRQGIQGLLAQDGSGPVVYMVCKPSSHYFRVMTGCRWMPVLIGEEI